MIILQQPDAFCFSSALKDIIIQSAENIRILFQTGPGIDPFLEEIYFPDSDGKIYIRDLEKLFLPYISKQSLKQTFYLYFPDVNPPNGLSIYFSVQYCIAEIDIPVVDFISNRFLTLLQGEKITYPNQKEFLSIVVPEETTVTIKARRQSGTIETQTLNVTTLNQVVTIDVSPVIFEDPETINYIVVLAGLRTFTYYLRLPSVPDVPQFLFLNAFGVKETFIPAGLILRENKYDNQFGSFIGRYRKYNIDLVKNYTANTGVMTEDMAEWIEDLFMSKDVFLLSSAGIEKEIVIEDATVKRSSARDELPAIEFKYRLSKYNQHEYNLSRSRIFDDSFDYTFN